MSNGDNYNGPTLPNGFSFSPGELIPSAPYVFPGEGDLIYLLELAGEYAGGWVEVVADIIVLILDLIDELVSLFQGLPTADKTQIVAQRLANGINPAAHILATQIVRNLQQNSIYLSSSDAAAQKVLGSIRKQGEALLVAQGVTQARAASVIDAVWSQTTSGTQPLPPELNTALSPQLSMVGATELWNLYTGKYNQAINEGQSPRKAAGRATKTMLNDGKLGDIGRITIQPQPTPPPPTCPDGQQWDPVQQKCVPIVSNPPPPTPCQFDGNAPQDEVTEGLACINQNLASIAASLANLGASPGQGGGGVSDACCTNLVNALATATSELAAIATAISSSTPPSVTTNIDLAPVTAALDALVAAVTNREPEPPVDLSTLNANAQGEIDARAADAANHSAVTAQVAADFGTLSQGLT
jgi:hypothetical protein